MNVEVNNLSTVGNQVVNRVDSISLNNGGECGHLALSTRMPDHTLDEAFASRSDGIVVNLGGGSEKSHGCLVWYVNIITPQEGVLRGHVTLYRVDASEVC